MVFLKGTSLRKNMASLLQSFWIERWPVGMDVKNPGPEDSALGYL